MQYLNIAAIGLGGCLGALARFYLNEVVVKRFPEAPYWGTFTVNVLGCLFIGFLMGFVVAHQHSFPTWLYFLLITGFLGSLTTFSTFGYQAVELLRESRFGECLLYIAANLLCGLLAVVLGWLLSTPWTR